MEKSLFIQYVLKYFAPVILGIVEKVNGKTGEQRYYFKEMLGREYTPTLKWGSLTSNGRAVAADVVSMDSSLPLKKRDSIRLAEGDVPKLGMKMYLGERELTDLNILQGTNQGGERDGAIMSKLFEDSKKCIVGVWEQLEGMFLEALSTGVTTIGGDTNTGTAIRIDFNHPDANKFGVQVPWGDASSLVIDDIENVLSTADAAGRTIRFLMMDRATFKNLRNSDQAKQTFAASIGFAGSNIPTPNISQLNEAFNEEFGVEIVVVNRPVSYEKNGKTITKKPFASNTVVFLEDLNVGNLFWGTLAEKNHPAKQVTYADADEYILVSKYHKVDPLREFTSSQALVVPVIDNVDGIYLMDTTQGATDSQTEGDEKFDYEGDEYKKASVIIALNIAAPGTNAKSNWKDATLLNRINQLSVEALEVFESLIVKTA